MEDTEYPSTAYGPLRPGQVVLVGTDGVWEMPNAAGEQFGKQRLRDVIRMPSEEPGKLSGRSSTGSPTFAATAGRWTT